MPDSVQGSIAQRLNKRPLNLLGDWRRAEFCLHLTRMTKARD